MKLPRITQLVREQAGFTHYEDGKLWYQVTWSQDDGSWGGIFDFPIPIDDAGGGKFLPIDRALTFMRWMRKHLEYLQSALEEGTEGQGQ